MNMSIRDLILLHVRADGPVSFASICLYVDEQYSGIVDTGEHVIADVVTGLIRDERLALYDDGVSFVGVE